MAANLGLVLSLFETTVSSLFFISKQSGSSTHILYPLTFDIWFILSSRQCNSVSRSIIVRINKTKCCCDFVFLYFFFCQSRTTFDVKADTHLDLMHQAEQAVLDGTSKWSCKIASTGGFHRILLFLLWLSSPSVVILVTIHHQCRDHLKTGCHS